jgi:hypothetical protein
MNVEIERNHILPALSVGEKFNSLLVGADDPESRELAEETIRSNQKEIKKLEEWLERHADRSSSQRQNAK